VDAGRTPDARLSGDSPADVTSMVSPLPEGSGWAVNRAAPDSGDVDLFEIRLAGSVRRLTHGRGVDRDPSHAPDGSRIVFATQRFDSLGRFDLAVLNLRNATVRPLVRGTASDESPVWSPDGSRIAFIRRRSTSYLHDLCIVT
jgi:Tol biopolymer transport system component